MSTKRRVLLKLSGEAFGGGSIGLDPKVVRNIAEQVASAVREGVQVAIVVGGGNFFRGAQLAREGLERSRADYMGMLGTVDERSGPPGLHRPVGDSCTRSDGHHDGPGR